MAHDTAISFKASLAIGANTEIRRFVIDNSAVSSFNCLEGKLRIIFPTLLDKTFTVTWRDNEGDFVVISRDDELIIALTEMREDPRRLYITINGSLNTNVVGQGDAAVHDCVVCDICDGPVCGYRYKCAQCPDFDLCATCEGHGNHSEHVMIRIPNSLTTTASRRMSHHMEKTISRFVDLNEKCGKAGKCEDKCNSPRKGKRSHRHREADSVEGVSSIFKHLFKDINECRDKNTSEGNKCKTKKRSPGSPFFVSFADNASSSSKEGAQRSTECPKNSEQNDSQDNCLRTIGQVIASILDPLGIDVDIDVRTKSTNESDKVTEKTEEPHQTFDSKDTSEESTSAEFIAEESLQKINTESENTQNTIEPGTESEWTLVDGTTDEGATISVSSSSSNSDHMETNDNTNNKDVEITPLITGSSETNTTNTIPLQNLCTTSTPLYHRQQVSQGIVPPTSQEFVAPTTTAFIPPPTAQGFMSQGFVPPIPQGFPTPMTAGFNFHQMAQDLQKHIQNQLSAATNAGTSTASNVTDAATSSASNIGKAATNAANISATTAANIAAGVANAAANTFASLYPNLTTVHSSTNTMPFPHGNVTTNVHVDTNIPSSTQGSSTTTTSSISQRPVPTIASNTPASNETAQPNPRVVTGVGKQTGAINKDNKAAAPSAAVHRAPAPTAPVQASHPDPRIAQALNIMMGMGFNNEGGWLSTVLEQAGGDVNKAIDLLQPVRKM